MIDMLAQALATIPALRLAELVFAALFLVAGLVHAIGWRGGVQEMVAVGLPLPFDVNALVATLQIGGGLLLAAGTLVAPAALALGGFVVLAGLLAHQPWRGPERTKQAIALRERFALGASLLLIASLNVQP